MRARSTCSVSRWLRILSVSLAWMLCVSANASAQTPPPPVATTVPPRAPPQSDLHAVSPSIPARCTGSCSVGSAAAPICLLPIRYAPEQRDGDVEAFQGVVAEGNDRRA